MNFSRNTDARDMDVVFLYWVSSGALTNYMINDIYTMTNWLWWNCIGLYDTADGWSFWQAQLMPPLIYGIDIQITNIDGTTVALTTTPTSAQGSFTYTTTSYSTTAQPFKSAMISAAVTVNFYVSAVSPASPDKRRLCGTQA